MDIGVINEKGGVAKTTTAINLALQLSEDGNTVLFDGDRTENATKWAGRGRDNGYESRFRVAPVEAAAMLAPRYKHKVFDTGQQPGIEAILRLAQYTDLLVIPSKPVGFDPDGLGETIRALRSIRKDDGSEVQFIVLFTQIEPRRHARRVEKMRQMLVEAEVSICEMWIPRLKAFETSAERGCTVDMLVKEDPYAAAGEAAYKAVVEEILRGR